MAVHAAGQPAGLLNLPLEEGGGIVGTIVGGDRLRGGEAPLAGGSNLTTGRPDTWRGSLDRS